MGVVGVGSLGQHHARILGELEEVRMVGIHDTDPGRARTIGDRLDVPVHTDLGHLLAEADAVVVAVPTTHHEAVARAAIDGGCGVLVEKPLAPDVAAADRILAAAREAGVVVQTGHSERFNPALVAAEPWLDQPLFVESHRMAPFTPRSTDVAVVLDLMIHDVDLVMALVGRPLREYAASGIPVLTSNLDIANARLSFENGAVANLTASRVSLERMRKIRIFQRSGYLSLDLARGSGEFLRLKRELPALRDERVSAALPGASEGGSLPAEALAALDLGEIVERIPLTGDDVEPLRRELENFRDAVLGRADPVVSGDAGRSALSVALSIEERIENHVVDTRPA